MNDLKIKKAFTPIEVVNLVVPDNVLVPCPKKKGYALTRAKNCLKCEVCCGFFQLVENPELIPFDKAYIVNCGQPLTRRLSMLAED